MGSLLLLLLLMLLLLEVEHLLHLALSVPLLEQLLGVLLDIDVAMEVVAADRRVGRGVTVAQCVATAWALAGISSRRGRRRPCMEGRRWRRAQERRRRRRGRGGGKARRRRRSQVDWRGLRIKRRWSLRRLMLLLLLRMLVAGLMKKVGLGGLCEEELLVDRGEELRIGHHKVGRRRKEGGGLIRRQMMSCGCGERRRRRREGSGKGHGRMNNRAGGRSRGSCARPVALWSGSCSLGWSRRLRVLDIRLDLDAGFAEGVGVAALPLGA